MAHGGWYECKITAETTIACAETTSATWICSDDVHESQQSTAHQTCI